MVTSYGMPHDWYDQAFEDIRTVALTLGIFISNIHFKGFSYQGQGACFEGRYRYRVGAHHEVRVKHPHETKIHEIADRLLACQQRHFYRLRAGATLARNESSVHEYAPDITVTRAVANWGYEEDVSDETRDAVTEIFRDFMRWMYRTLEAEYQALTSDDAVDEALEEGEYLFSESGRPMGTTRHPTIAGLQ